MKKSPPTLQDNYQYDALDRLTTRNATHRFYQNDRIATEVEGANTRRFIAFDAQPLAVQEGQATSLLATDRQTSVLPARQAHRRMPIPLMAITRPKMASPGSWLSMASTRKPSLGIIYWARVIGLITRC